MPALIVKNGPLAGQRLRVIAPLTLGREDVDVLMDAPMVSRRHAVVRPVDGGLEIDDLGSTNGTWVNGERIEGVTPPSPRATWSASAPCSRSSDGRRR